VNNTRAHSHVDTSPKATSKASRCAEDRVLHVFQCDQAQCGQARGDFHTTRQITECDFASVPAPPNREVCRWFYNREPETRHSIEGGGASVSKVWPLPRPHPTVFLLIDQFDGGKETREAGGNQRGGGISRCERKLRRCSLGSFPFERGDARQFSRFYTLSDVGLGRIGIEHFDSEIAGPEMHFARAPGQAAAHGVTRIARQGF